jgi:Fur family ferric uptake transcriptional regulator
MARRDSQPSNQLIQARDDIRTAGFRATPARIATLVELRNSKSPMTHAVLAERLGVYGFDKATAFRNLNDLAERGLLRRTELGDHVWRFEAVDPKEAHENGHPHFLCVDCGSVTCLNDLQLTSSSRKKSESVGEVTEILLRGHCKECK